VGQVLIPDRAQAERFLELLELGGDFWFQTQLEPKPEGEGAPQKFHGTLAGCWDRLVKINTNGSAIWVQINAGNGRSNGDITRIRAYFVDLDGVSAEPLFSSALPADIIVESSPGKFHGYWLTGNAPLDPYPTRMHALADRFDGDHSVCHLARVMRLPGFIHRKGEPFMSRIVKVREGL
jgi:hypothetical protein